MPHFELPEPYKIDGKKLANEIARDKTIPFTPTVNTIVFHPPNKVEVVGLPDAYADDVAMIVSRHTPRRTVRDRIYRAFRRPR